KPAGEVLPVLLPPSGIHPDLLHGLLDHPANLRSLAAPEEALHVLRRLGSRKGLGDLHEPTDEEPGLRVPPVQLGPVLLDEGPRESLRGLGEHPAVLVMSEAAQDRRALQGVEVALAGLRIPAAPLAGRA